MITFDNKKIKFIDSYLLKEGRLTKILKTNNLSREVYLEKVANDFKDNILVEKMFQSNDILSKEIFSSIKERLKKQIKLENSSLYVPIQEFVDVINFGIFTEVDNLKESTRRDREIKTLSSFMGGVNEKKSIESTEDTFSNEDIISILENISIFYTKNTEIRNNYFIITFD